MRIGSVFLLCGLRWWRPSSWMRTVDHPCRKVLVRNGLESYYRPARVKRINIKPRRIIGGFAVGPVMIFRKGK